MFSFFFNDTATTEIYTLSLHDALPISARCRSSRRETLWFRSRFGQAAFSHRGSLRRRVAPAAEIGRAHAELQSQSNLVCRLLLEKKKIKYNIPSAPRQTSTHFGAVQWR